MPLCIRDVMAPNPVTLDALTSVQDAARVMQERYIGDVLVTEDGHLLGIVTDRDIVIRCVAEHKSPSMETIGSLCSKDLVTLEPSTHVSEAIRLMKERAIRRIPVVEDDRAVGIVSIGDLAIRLDHASPLGQISAASPRA